MTNWKELLKTNRWEKDYEELLLMAIEALEFECGNRCAEQNPCNAKETLQKLREELGEEMSIFLLTLLAVVLGNLIYSFLHGLIFTALKANRYENNLAEKIAKRVKLELEKK